MCIYKCTCIWKSKLHLILLAGICLCERVPSSLQMVWDLVLASHVRLRKILPPLRRSLRHCLFMSVWGGWVARNNLRWVWTFRVYLCWSKILEKCQCHEIEIRFSSWSEMSRPAASQGIREGPESNQCSGLRWPHLNGRSIETHFNTAVLLKGLCSGRSVEGLWRGCRLPPALLAAEVLLDSCSRWCFLRWSAQIASHCRSHEQASGCCSVGLRISQSQ